MPGKHAKAGPINYYRTKSLNNKLLNNMLLCTDALWCKRQATLFTTLNGKVGVTPQKADENTPETKCNHSNTVYTRRDTRR